MKETRVPLYARLPQIYRIRDEEQPPGFQLRSYLALVENAFGAIHENIEALYHDLFIETCDDWVIPYIADLLGTTHLSGEPRTLRADVADTVALRRRKGTLGAIELLTFNLTQWGVHCVELRDNLVWHQHLNHQRPDAQGRSPYARPGVTRHTVVRGGTVTLRDPGMLSLLATPFDPFAYTVDVKPANSVSARYNLPNLAIFLWRLEDYRIRVSRPVLEVVTNIPAAPPGHAKFAVGFSIHPLGEPLRLFNTYRFDPRRQPPVLSHVDQTPGPISPARLHSNSPAGNPDAYVSVQTYEPTNFDPQELGLGDQGFQMHVPDGQFNATQWSFRGENLCAWEKGLRRPLLANEIAIDPIIGRVMFGVATKAQKNALSEELLLSFTYGAVGPVGAQPVTRPARPAQWLNEAVEVRVVNGFAPAKSLQAALSGIDTSAAPIVIEIQDSLVHSLDLAGLPGTLNEDGGPNLRLNRSLIIRAADGHRPIIRLARPLRFRPTHVIGADAEEQKRLDAIIANLTVRFEGIYLTRATGFAAGEPLIARAAVGSLEMSGCTLDPGGFRQLDGARAPIRDGLRLRTPYGFMNNPAEETVFKATPKIILQRTVAGPLLIDEGYTLSLSDCLIDAGRGVNSSPGNVFALTSATDPVGGWGPPTTVSGATFFGRVRVAELSGSGGIWVHRLEVFNHQAGCIKFSYFSGAGDRLPQNHACVAGPDVALRFTSEWFGHPAHGQLAPGTDSRITDQGPKQDLMGAFGFLLEAHRWRNLQIRFREFIPVGIRPLLIPIT